MVKSVKPISGIKGFDVVQRNLQRELVKITERSIEGLIEASIFIRRDMDNTSPKIPVDTNNLRASWFTFPGKVTGKPVLIIGFSANYAVFVHEKVDGGVKWNRDGSGPKFLEAALNRNHAAILAIIARKAKIN